ncbi:MAG TPA: methyltransferase domain-containing protein [Thermoanaerobaculia bacterium]
MPFAGLRSPWDWAADEQGAAAACNICGWSGPAFAGCQHSESAICLACGSIARDRFLFHCFVRRTPPGSYRVLETSPRLGVPYRRAMSDWFAYRASDFDERAHRADLHLDLQDLDLEDESVDVILTPHVLEHVPETGRALDEIHRVLAPGGRMFLQVPVQQGRTAPPATPELHGDSTPVFWRFGVDLTARLREHGFRARLLCTDGFYSLVEAGARTWPDPPSAEFDVDSILAAARTADLLPIADREISRRLSFSPAYMFLTWEAVKAAAAGDP